MFVLKNIFMLCIILSGYLHIKHWRKTYDFIYGPVADDDVYTTFTLYTAGVLSKEQTIDALKVKKLYNQLVLTSEKALSSLKFIGRVTVTIRTMPEIKPFQRFSAFRL